MQVYIIYEFIIDLNYLWTSVLKNAVVLLITESQPQRFLINFKNISGTKREILRTVISVQVMLDEKNNSVKENWSKSALQTQDRTTLNADEAGSSANWLDVETLL